MAETVVIDPSQINPHGRYPTRDAARIFRLTPKGFLDRARRSAVRPANTASKPRLWRGVDLWAMLDYQPTPLARAEIDRRQRENLSLIQAERKRARAEANGQR